MSGSVVPAYNRPDIRELLVYAFRGIYRVEYDEVRVLTVFHGSRPYLPKHEELGSQSIARGVADRVVLEIIGAWWRNCYCRRVLPAEMSDIPADSEWRSVPWCLDIAHSYNHFFGKSLAEARQLFEENAIHYQEDLMYMPTPCLRYYMCAYSEYLLSDRSQGDSDGASCYFGLIEIRHSDINTFASDAVEQTRAVLQKLATHQEWYDADPAVYGDFGTRARHAINLLTQLS